MHTIVTESAFGPSVGAQVPGIAAVLKAWRDANSGARASA
jgi:hypothetical protein